MGEFEWKLQENTHILKESHWIWVKENILCKDSDLGNFSSSS